LLDSGRANAFFHQDRACRDLWQDARVIDIEMRYMNNLLVISVCASIYWIGDLLTVDGKKSYFNKLILLIDSNSE